MEAMKMWTWRILLKVSWTESKSNINLLNQVGEKRILLITIKEGRGKMIGHLLCIIHS